MKHNLKSLLFIGGVFAVSAAVPLALSGTAGATEWQDKNRSTVIVKLYQEDQHKDHIFRHIHAAKDDKNREGHDKKTYRQAEHNDKQHHFKQSHHGQDVRKQDHHKKPHQQQSKQHHKQHEHHKRVASHHSDKQLHYKLDALLREHVTLGVAAIKAELHHSSDAWALKQAIDRNGWKIAKTVDQLYPGTQHLFLQLWRQHLAYYAEYLWGAKKHDEATKQQAKRSLAAFAHDVSNLLNNYNLKVDEHRLKHQLAKHGDLVTGIIDKLVARDYAGAHALAHQAEAHMSKIARTISAVQHRD